MSKVLSSLKLASVAVITLWLLAACGRQEPQAGGGGGGGGGGAGGGSGVSPGLTGDSFLNGDGTRPPYKERFLMESYERYRELEKSLRRDGHRQPTNRYYYYPGTSNSPIDWEALVGTIT